MEKVFNSSEFRTRVQTDVFFGELTVGEQKKLFFPFQAPNEYCDIPTDDLSGKVEDFSIDCHCMDLFKILQDGFELNFNSNNAQIMGKKRWAYYASMRVFWADGLPLKVKNNLGQLVHNPEKAQTVLEVFGTVKLPENG